MSIVGEVIDPSVRSNDCQQMNKILKLPRTLMDGTEAMRAAGETFLPREDAESQENYDSRVARSFLFGGFERTVEILAGEVFDKPLQIKGKTPQQFVDFADNIDLQGHDLTQFSREAFEKALWQAQGFILVELPKPPKDENGNVRQTTAAEDKALGRRPYWVWLSGENLLGGMTEMENGRVIYKQLRFLEYVVEPDGVFGEKEIKQVRVLTPGVWQIWREHTTSDGRATWIVHDEGALALPDIIPIVQFITGRAKSQFNIKPPLTGLAELNQAHWISSSDQNNILHFTRIPFLFGRMLDKDPEGQVIVSPRNLLHSNNPDSDLKFVEHTGAAMGDGWKDQERLEMLMGLYGLQLVSDARSGNVTATEKALTTAKTSSFLNSLALGWQSVVNEAIKLTCAVLKITYDGGVMVNTDFSLALSNFDNKIILEGYSTGLIDRGTTIDELKRRGTLSDSLDLADILAALENEQRGNNLAGSDLLNGSLF